MRYVAQYIRDGRLEIDNNGAERQLRGVAVGRKNWLFAGSMKGLHRAALLYSLVQSAKLAGVEPWAYLKDVLDRLPNHPHTRINGFKTVIGCTATHFRHFHVQNHQIDPVFFGGKNLQRLLPIICGEYLISQFLKHVLGHFQDYPFIIHKQNGFIAATKLHHIFLPFQAGKS